MTYSLDQFCKDCHDILAARNDDEGRDKIRTKLVDLLKNEDFVSETFNEDTPPSKRELYHDPETDVYVLAHVQEAGKGGNPHTHGESWAIYGNAKGDTVMTEWRRVNPESEDHAEVEVVEQYTITPGTARAYGPGMMHSTAHPAKAWVIRVTGTDLDNMPRFRFDPRRDKILAKA
jgi:predicted metal-dependent enzyme (double-stranded beta helix superfamily)